jgi:hypothetical protein
MAKGYFLISFCFDNKKTPDLQVNLCKSGEINRLLLIYSFARYALIKRRFVLFADGIFFVFRVIIGFYNSVTLAVSLYLIEGIDYLLLGCLAEKRNDYDSERGKNERGKKLVNVKRTAERSDKVLPDEYDSTAGKYTCECACLGSSLPK